MKKLLLIAVATAVVMAGCSKSDTDDNPNNLNKPDSGKLPPLPDKTDVCSAMDDITFMNYCYENFDVNKDGKISELEYNAVKEINCDGLQITSFKGIEYFANLETFSCKENAKIKEIDLSHNKHITLIGDSAFSNCSNLQSIKLPNSIMEIGDQAFHDCTSMKGVYIIDIAAWCNIKFNGYYSNPLYYAHNLYLNGELVKGLVIPDSITAINDYAFNGCTCMTIATISNSVTKIGVSAFYKCTGLTGITITNSVTTIDMGALYGCTGLTSITIPNSVTKIGYSALYGCTGLTSITIPDSVTSIGGAAFANCTGLANATIGNGITTIGSSAFEDCTGLTSIIISDSVTAIGYEAFRNCTSLASVTIPNSITKIGEWAFSGCTGLTNITFPDSVTTIGNDAFHGCKGLTSITIPGSVTTIGFEAFRDCTRLISVYCKRTTPPALGSWAFDDIKSNARLYVPRASVSAYKSVEGWKEYASQIVGYDF